MRGLTRRTLLAQMVAAAAAAGAGRRAGAADLQPLRVASALSDDIAPVVYGIAAGVLTAPS